MNKIIVGDAFEVLKVLPKDSVHLIITSPPYNLDKPYSNHNDKMSYSDYLEWMGKVWRECQEVLIDGGRLCINIGENKRQNITYPTFSAFIQQCIDLKMLYRGTIIWNKNSAAKHTAWGSWNSCSNPHIVPRHEYIIIFSKGTHKLDGNQAKCDLNKDGIEFMGYTRSVWNFGTESRKKIGHPTPFPVELPNRLIKFYSYKDNVVLDPFAGSGTVGVAAIGLERHFILIDNSYSYCNLAQRRINSKINSDLFISRKNKNVKIIEEGELSMAKPRNMYKYNFKDGNKIVHRGITDDLERREQEHQQKWPKGHISQVGHRTTEESAREWEEEKGCS